MPKQTHMNRPFREIKKHKMRELSGSDIFEYSLPVERTCDPSYYGTSNGCDYECGARDPDCDDPSLDVFGCSADSDICVNTNGGTVSSSKRHRLNAWADYDNAEKYQNLLDPTKDPV